MGIFGPRIRERYPQASVEPELRTAPLELVPTREQFLAMRTLWALTSPAYKRGHDLICSTVAQLPLSQYGNGLRVEPVIETSGRAAWVTKERTVSDLVNHAVAFWKITGTLYGPRFTQLPAGDAELSDDGRTVTHAGKQLTVSDPLTPPELGEVVVFTGRRDGCVTLGKSVILAALAQQDTTLHYAQTPHPAAVLKNVSGYDLSDEEIVGDVTGYEQARAKGAVAYLNAGYELLDAKGWSPTELALKDQRNGTALDVARLLNLDASWLNAEVGGTSLTYSNRVDLRQDLIDLTCSAYILPIEQRLSMPDCFGGNVRFSTSAFLRGNVMDRAKLAADLFAAQIITLEEARLMVSDAPGENIA